MYNPDLREIDDISLMDHYANHGVFEGRISGEIKNREDFINLIPTNSSVLEIGPLCFPWIDTTKNNVKYIDYFTTEELRENHKTDVAVDINKICKIDYAIKEGNYTDVIFEKFDIVFSSHNIEHVPCVVTFLNNLSSIMKNDGYVFLCIPDFRYCFDHFRKESNIFDIINAFLSKSTAPSITQVLESNFFTTHNNSVDHWQNEIKSSINKSELESTKFYKEKTTEIIKKMDTIHNLITDIKSGKYIDSHCWKFSPFVFENIIDILFQGKYIDLKIERIYPTLMNSNEFYCILKKQ